KRDQEERKVYEIEEILHHLVDDLRLPAVHSRVLLVHSNRMSLTSSGMTGVIWTCTSHSWPVFRGRTGMYCSESWKLDGKTPKLDLFPGPEADRHCPDVPGRRLPVRQNVGGVRHVPAVTEEDNGNQPAHRAQNGPRNQLLTFWILGGTHEPSSTDGAFPSA